MNRKIFVGALLLAFSFPLNAQWNGSPGWQDEYPGLSIEQAPVRPLSFGPEPSLTQEDRDRDIQTLESRIVGRDVSSEAVAATARAIQAMLDQADAQVVHNLVDRQIYIFIIPKDRRLTDIPEFSSLRGTRTFDGRLWDDVRGVGYYPIPGSSRVGVAFGEENLLGGTNDPPTGYPALFLLAHEFSHSVQDAGLSSELYEQSVQIYNDAMTRPGGTGLGKYADSNAYEDFAQAAAAYFGVGHLDSPRQHGEPARIRLFRNEPRMVALLSQVYGPPRNLWPLYDSLSSMAGSYGASPLR